MEFDAVKSSKSNNMTIPHPKTCTIQEGKRRVCINVQ